jgi:hypothetical protein
VPLIGSDGYRSLDEERLQMGQDELSQVAKRAMEDASFREQLKSDPQGAASAAGIQLSDEDLQRMKATELGGLSDDALVEHMSRFWAGD